MHSEESTRKRGTYEYRTSQPEETGYRNTAPTIAKNSSNEQSAGVTSLREQMKIKLRRKTLIRNQTPEASSSEGSGF